MTTGRVDELYERARGAGAVGGKLVGAGGGGFLLLYAPEPGPVREVMAARRARPRCGSASTSTAASARSTRDGAVGRHRRLRPDGAQARRRPRRRPRRGGVRRRPRPGPRCSPPRPAPGPCPTSTRCCEHRPDVVVVATTHDALAGAACRALEGGAHVLVEKPAGRTVEEVDRIAAAAAAAGRRVKVGFNHRFHPGIMRADQRGPRRPPRRADVPARPLRPRRPARLRPRVARRARGVGRRRAARPGHAPARPQPLAARAAAAALGAAAHQLLGHAGGGQRRAHARRARRRRAPSRPST